MLSASPTVNLPLVTGSTTPDISGTPYGLSPSMIERAYQLEDITFVSNGQTVAANGAGETIAIVDAYSDPNIVSDLQTFDSNFGISNDDAEGQAALTVATPDGAAPENAQWTTEQSLDVEWAHAVAPGASILLVETPSDSLTDLLNGVVWAADQPGVVAVSMSFGGSEFSGETAYDSDFTTPAGHEGVTFVASAGDNATAEYPSMSPNVLAVGGTTLSVDNQGDWLGETYWSGGGGGNSPYENTKKPDVSYDGDPDTGFLIYDSTPYDGATGWQVEGGTSAGAPQWAAIIAIVDQGRSLAGRASLDGATQTIPDLYALPSTDFNPISGGGLVGLGSPVGNRLISGLVGGGTTVGAPTQLVFAQQPTNITAGQVFSPNITVDVENAAGNIVTTDDSEVTLSVASGPGNLTGTVTVAAKNGVATFTNISVNEAGGYTLLASDGALTGATSNHFTVSEGQLVFVRQPSNAMVGSTIAPPVEVAIETAGGGSIISSSAMITLTLSSGALSGTTTVSAVDGVAVFSNLSVDSAGTYSLTASGTSLASALSSSFTIAIPDLVFVQDPTPSFTGLAMPAPVDVAVEDAYGNILNVNTTITLSLASGPGNISGTLSAQTSDGVAVIGGLVLSAAGDYTLKATSGADTSAISSPFEVVAPQLSFEVQPIETIEGLTIAPSVEVDITDAGGSILANDDATVTLSVASGPGDLSGTLTATAVNGVATFAHVFAETSGTYTLMASSANAISADSTPFTIAPPGSVDVANWGTISGWAYDPSDPSASINIEVDFSGGPSQQFSADNARPDLVSFIGSADHGFTYSTPMLSAGSHTASVYAILKNGTRELLSTQTIVSQNSLFDESYYLQEYPTVAAAVANGEFATGYDHYLQYGQYEGFSPNPYWNETWYLEENPDVAAAVRSGKVSSGFMQYYDYGQYENRGGLLYFNTTYYLDTNADVAAAVKAGDVSSAFEHFCDFGQYEGRDPMLNFSFSVYEADNEDIMPYISGEPFTSAYQQYIEYGQYEGRTAV